MPRLRLLGRTTAEILQLHYVGIRVTFLDGCAPRPTRRYAAAVDPTSRVCDLEPSKNAQEPACKQKLDAVLLEKCKLDSQDCAGLPQRSRPFIVGAVLWDRLLFHRNRKSWSWCYLSPMCEGHRGFAKVHRRFATS